MKKQLNNFLLGTALLMVVCPALIPGTCSAQVIINLRMNSSQGMTVNDLWNMQVINNGNDAQKVVLEVTLTDNQFNPVVLATSAEFTLKKGINNVSLRDVGFPDYHYGATEAGQILKSSRSLPYGWYVHCAKLKEAGTGSEIEIACQEQEINPLMPVILITPFDKEEILTRNPNFSWTDLAIKKTLPKNKEHSYKPSNISYRMIMVELMDGQDPNDGIAANLPVFTQENLSVNMMLYPASAYKLLAGKHYAWQIQTLMYGVPVNYSEVWEFSLPEEKKKEEVRPSYVLLQKKPGTTYITVFDNKLHFTFDGIYISSALNYKIYGNGKVIDMPVNRVGKDGVEEAPVKNYGYNKFTVDLSGYKLGKGYYHLEVKNEKGEAYYLRFSISQ